MRAHLGTTASLLVLAAIHGFADNHTHHNASEDKTLRKREGKKQIPTFVGSDGVVRKVSPSAILEEMKRCLPPGIPIPMAAIWPELPPNLGEEAPEDNDVGEDDDYARKKTEEDGVTEMANEHNLKEGRRRVMRSHAAVKNRSEDFGVSSGDGLNVKLEMPARESVIFSPTEPTQKKFADVLKELFSKYDRNSTGFDVKYVDEGAVVDRFKKKFKSENSNLGEDYQDYDDDEQNNKRAHGRVCQRSKKSKRGKRRGTTKRYDVPLKMSPKAWRGHGKPVYDYDYDGAAEDGNMPEDEPEFRIRAHRQVQRGVEELERQIGLNEYLEALTKRLDDGDNEGSDANRLSKAAKCSARAGNVDQAKDYKKILATVMDLNSSLVRLLERAIVSSRSQKAAKTEEPDKTCRTDDKADGVESSATTFLLECMELLMQKRRGLKKHEDSLRSKEQDSHLTETRNDHQQVESSKQTKHSNTPLQFDDLNLLKWLVKWYLDVTK